MLIIDPASGAMYRIADKTVHADLGSNRDSIAGMELQIIDINQLPEGVNLVRIN